VAVDFGVYVFGPRLEDPGGMASVERVHVASLRGEGLAVRHVATYTSNSLPRSVVLFSLALVRAAALPFEPTVAHLHVSQRGSVLRCLVLAIILRVRRVPVVCTVHGSSFRPFALRHPLVTGALLSRSDIVTVLNSATLDVVHRLCPAADVRYLPNAVPLPPETELTLPEELDDIFFAGEVGTRKGVDTLLEAWGSLEELERGPRRLVLAGPLGDIDRPPDTGNVVWLGVLAQEGVRDQLLRSRCGVLASRAEAMPMFILEVMAHGRPIIATDIEQLRDVVGDGGVVVPPGDAVALAEALRLVLADGTWVRHAGSAARRRVAAEYSQMTLVGRLMAIYLDAVERHDGS
jgi:glycosyltransferase involved in cell wall biosynthesis